MMNFKSSYRRWPLKRVYTGNGPSICSTSEQIPSNILHRMRPEEDNIERQNGRMVATDTEKIIVEQYNRMDSLQQPAAFTNRHDVEGQDAALNASSPEWSPMSSATNST